MKHFMLAVISLGFLFLGANGVYAQDNPTTEQGLKPYGSFHGGDIDSISMVNLKPNIHIPLVSYPQRGQLSLGFSIVYQNPVYVPNVQCIPNTTPPQCSASYYMAPAPQIQIVPDFIPSIGCGHWYTPPNCRYYNVTESDGALHRTGQIDTNDYRSLDATGYIFNASTSLLTDRNGTRYQYGYCCNPFVNQAFWYPTKIEDTNGNEVTASLDSNHNVTSWTDTLGRTVAEPPSLYSNGTQPPSTGNTALCPTSGLLTVYRAYAWTVPGYNGVNATYTVCTAALTMSYTPTGCNQQSGNDNCDGFNGVVIYPTQSIVLPNGTAWSFEYDGAGALAKIIFPTGGSISYVSGEYTMCLGLNHFWSTYARAVSSRAVDANDGTGAHTWTYSQTQTNPGIKTTVTSPSPFLDATVHTMTQFSTTPGVTCSLYETQVDHYQGSATLLETTKTVYNYVGNPYDTNGGGAYLTAINVVPKSVTTVYPNGKTSQVQTDYDTGVPMIGSGTGANVIYGVQLAKREYDFPSGTALLRTTTNTYQFQSVGAYLTYNLLNLLSMVKVTDSGGTQRALTTYGYDNGTPTGSGVTTQHDSAPPNGNTRGNQTSVTRWLNSPAGNLISSKVFLDTGEVHTSTTPKGNTTTFHPHMCNGAFPQVVTNAKGQATTYNYDCNTGLLLSVTDPNILTTSHEYDVMWRLTQTSYPNGGLDTYCYTDETGGTGCSQGSPPYEVVTTSKLLSGNMIKTEFFDGLGRSYEKQFNSDPSGTDYVITTYDADGRVASVTNPYRSTGDSTYGVTGYTYDALNRKTLVTDPDGSTIHTAYCGPTTLVTDEAGKWRRSATDGLGRLIEVDEPNSTTATVNSNGCPGTGEPIWITNYTYDALNNLANVTQNGSRQRSFVYDSVSRLLTSNNPEIGLGGAACPINYSYDNDNNLATKIAPKQNGSGNTCTTTTITTTYSYDALDRLTGKTDTYPGDPAISYGYDGSACLGLSTCANIGHRTSMTDAAGSESFAYDTVNRKSADQRTMNETPNAITKTTSYVYDYNGAVASLTYPSGHTLNYTYNTMGQTTQAIDDANAYMQNGSYAPHGELNFRSAGVAVNLTIIYNSRLQPCWTFGAVVPNSLPKTDTCTQANNPGTILDLKYNYNLGHDNGNLAGFTNDRNANRSETFTYDQVNRLLTAGTVSTCTSGCWSQTFGYDPWANLLTVTATGTATPLTLAVNANNHITTAQFAYDSAGNETADAAFGAYDWNAEGQLFNAGGSTYNYDGDGRRVSKSHETSIPSVYWYGLDGNVLDESDATGSIANSAFNEYIYVNGQRIARRDYQGNAYYYFDDQIGSARSMAYVPAGTRTATLCYEGDFYPYGAESIVTNTCPQNYKWTGKERDAETGNDNFDARYYSSTYGRFLSADWSAVPAAVPYANLTNPQTLNLYAMVRDNPESFVDLDGHDPTGGTAGGCGDATTGCGGTGQNTNGQDQKTQQSQQQSANWSASWQASASWKFFKEEVSGVADATVNPIISAVEHPIDTAEGIGHAIAHPLDTIENIGKGVVDTAKGVASGDPRAIGQVAGTVVATAVGAKGAQVVAEEGQGLRVVANEVRSGARAGELQHVGIVNNKGNIIHLGREGSNWHIGIGRGGGASGAGAAVHIPLPAWVGKLLNP